MGGREKGREEKAVGSDFEGCFSRDELLCWEMVRLKWTRREGEKDGRRKRSQSHSYLERPEKSANSCVLTFVANDVIELREGRRTGKREEGREELRSGGMRKPSADNIV